MNERSYDLIAGEWVEIGETYWGKARAMPVRDGIPAATKLTVDEAGHPDANGPTTIQYYENVPPGRQGLVAA